MAHDTSVNVGHEISEQRPTVADKRAYGTIATGDEFGAQRTSFLYRALFVLCCVFKCRTPEVMSGGLCRY